MGITSNAITQIGKAAAAKQVRLLQQMFHDASATNIDLAFQVEHFYEAELYKVLGYPTQGESYAALFDVSQSHITRLRTIARQAKRLGYTQKQIESIYRKTGHLSALAGYLTDLEKKISVYQAVAELREVHSSHSRTQFNITMSKTQARKTEKILQAFGMEVDRSTGRRYGVSEAMSELVKLASKHVDL